MNNQHIIAATPETWTASAELLDQSNIRWLMRFAGADSYDALHDWSARHRQDYWAAAIARLGIRLRRPFQRVVETNDGMETPRWLPGAGMNIVESCFQAPQAQPAIIYQPEGGRLASVSFGELEALTNRVANGLVAHGYQRGDSIAIIMPMTVEAVAAYLGIIKAGCIVVGIPESFRPPEMAARLCIAGAAAVFTQKVIQRGGKSHPLYETVCEARAPAAIVLEAGDPGSNRLRSGDRTWKDFLSGNDAFLAEEQAPGEPINVLFSSGTTGEPKAIPWSHTTPIKCAADAHFHQDVHPGDVLVWPTSPGWMMGPWLIFASLINRAALGLYYGSPGGRDFGAFVQDSQATMLGVVPTLVKAWRGSGCMTGLDWQALRLFSSTGECSAAQDMRWLMALGGHKPVIEYCGGTEIGGAYITSSIARPCVAGQFNSPALGLDFVILDEQGKAADCGELFLIPPSIGMSTELLNKDHHDIYYEGLPPGPAGELLRRHGDQVEKLPGGYWRALGRADDTMNLGGIKVSSAEIERVLQTVPGVVETAAIAVAADGGPSQLVVFAVVPADRRDKEGFLLSMQNAIRNDLNPLFKIHKLIIVDALPRTASNKIMRRTLRQHFLADRNGTGGANP